MNKDNEIKTREIMIAINGKPNLKAELLGSAEKELVCEIEE